MCGIIYINRIDGLDPRKMLDKRYEAQRARGYEGFGFVALKQGIVTGYERAESEVEISAKLAVQVADEVLFHHRYPTSTPNYAHCAHPIKVSNKALRFDYYVVHNGIVWNDDKIRPSHIEAGYLYTTDVIKQVRSRDTVLTEEVQWNDSETLAIELARDLDTIQAGVEKLSGSIAFIALQVDKETGRAVNLFFGRNEGSPLVIDHQEGVYVSITSEGKGKTIPSHTLYTLEYGTGKISEKEYSVGFDYSSYSRDDDPKEMDIIPLTEDQREARIQSLCNEWDKTAEELYKVGYEDERYEEIEARLQAIEQELLELDHQTA